MIASLMFLKASQMYQQAFLAENLNNINVHQYQSLFTTDLDMILWIPLLQYFQKGVFSSKKTNMNKIDYLSMHDAEILSNNYKIETIHCYNTINTFVIQVNPAKIM